MSSFTKIKKLTALLDNKLVIMIGLATCLCVSLLFNVKSCSHQCVISTTVDTLIVVDTVTVSKPVAHDSVILRYEKISYPVFRTLRDTVTNVRTYTDTIVDSVMVEIPIMQKEYGDTMYHAWISGYHVALDSIKVFPKTTIITKTQGIAVKKRWGVGPQAGVTYTSGKFAPYVGVGIQYSIFSW